MYICDEKTCYHRKCDVTVFCIFIIMTTEKYIMVKNTCDISLKNANCQNTTVITCTYINIQRDITDKFTQKPISYNFL